MLASTTICCRAAFHGDFSGCEKLNGKLRWTSSSFKKPSASAVCCLQDRRKCLFLNQNAFTFQGTGYVSRRAPARANVPRAAENGVNHEEVSKLGDDEDSSAQNAQPAEQRTAPKKWGVAEVCGVLTSMFPVWVATFACCAIVVPPAFTWFRGQLLVSGVALTMLGMGMTLSWKDIEGAARMKRELLAGVFLQYTIMPALGALIAAAMGLPHHYAVGIILVSCCPGGTASNIVTYLARGNVALSVLMTAVSTLLAAVMTPLLTAKLAGQLVPVDAKALFFSTVQVVLLPVLGGASIAHRFPRAAQSAGPIASLFAVITVALICASCIGQSSAAILASGVQLTAAVIALHAGGFSLGFLLAKLLGFESRTARTISIEVGMQNSALGVVLATQNFANPLTAAPCAVSSVCHSLLGSLLASFWYFGEFRQRQGELSHA